MITLWHFPIFSSLSEGQQAHIAVPSYPEHYPAEALEPVRSLLPVYTGGVQAGRARSRARTRVRVGNVAKFWIRAGYDSSRLYAPENHRNDPPCVMPLWQRVNNSPHPPLHLRVIFLQTWGVAPGYDESGPPGRKTAVRQGKSTAPKAVNSNRRSSQSTPSQTTHEACLQDDLR